MRGLSREDRRERNEQLKNRTRDFALGVVRLVAELPGNRIADIMGRQLLRSGTSVGANYRSACRARSRADFIAKMGIVEEEADESLYWLELLMESEQVTQRAVDTLADEGRQLLAMTVASIRTARANRD